MKKHTRSVNRAKEKLKNGNRKQYKGGPKKRSIRRVQSNPSGELQSGAIDALPAPAEKQPGEDSGGEGLGSRVDPSLPAGLGSEPVGANPIGGNPIVYHRAVGMPEVAYEVKAIKGARDMIYQLVPRPTGKTRIVEKEITR
jgi:hypothetical protein